VRGQILKAGSTCRGADVWRGSLTQLTLVARVEPALRVCEQSESHGGSCFDRLSMSGDYLGSYWILSARPEPVEGRVPIYSQALRAARHGRAGSTVARLFDDRAERSGARGPPDGRYLDPRPRGEDARERAET
jgi:hypothetical protein